MEAVGLWEYIHRFGTDRIRALVDIDMEPSPVKREDYDDGSYGIDDLEEAIRQIQTSPIELLDQQAKAMLNKPPSRELRNLVLDEGSRTAAATPRRVALWITVPP